MRFHRSMLMPRHAPSGSLNAKGGASFTATMSSAGAGGSGACAMPSFGNRKAAASSSAASHRPRPAGKPARCSGSAASRHRMIDDQHHDRADHRNKHAPQIEAGHAGGAERLEEEAACDRADDAEGDVEQEARALLVDDLAADETGNEPQNDPATAGHCCPPVSRTKPLRCADPT